MQRKDTLVLQAGPRVDILRIGQAVWGAWEAEKSGEIFRVPPWLKIFWIPRPLPSESAASIHNLCSGQAASFWVVELKSDWEHLKGEMFDVKEKKKKLKGLKQ